MTTWANATGEAGEASNLNDLETRIKAVVPSFSQHTWTQKTSSSPLSAANLNALEAAAAGGKIEVADVTDTAFAGGAVGDGSTDDTAAIQAAIDSLPQTPGSPRGGIVFFPRPSVNYKVTGSGSVLDLADTHNVTLLGGTLNGANEPATTGSGTSRINYTGTTATRMFDCRSTQGFLAQGLAFTHDASWSGTMFDFEHSGTGGDSQHARFLNCALAGYLQNTCTLVAFNNSIFGRIENCYIGRCARGIEGMTVASGFYSNSHVIKDCQFARCNEAILNFSDSLLVEGCGFEGTGGNIQHAYLQDDDATTVGPHVWIGNWFGDSFSSVPDYWIDYGSTAAVRRFVAIGNMWNQEKVAKFKGGDRNIVFIGNMMGQSSTDAVDLGSAAGRGHVFIGNDFVAAGTSGVDVIANRSAHFQKVFLGNAWGANDGTRGYDELVMAGASHIHKADADATPTTSSIHANAGSGASVAYTGSDLGGRITLTTGTGAGAGVSNLVVINFNKTFGTSLPHVVLTPSNQAAAALGGWYASVPSVTQFHLALDTGKTLGSSTAYQFHFQVV